MEESKQEVAVEAQELVLALVLLNQLDAAGQVIQVAVQKALLLDEVHEHQPVEHERGVPFTVSHVRDAFDKCQECAMLGLEAVVELLRHTVHIKGLPRPASYINQAEVF